MLRAIHIFPDFNNSHSINAIREKYDPLYHLIPPHVTLVFPFESSIPTEVLVAHLKEIIVEIKPFKIGLRGITGAEQEYLFLNIKIGNDNIIELHDTLYKGLLKQYLNRSFTYTPHLTVGRLNDKKVFELALKNTERFNETFDTTVRDIIVESIDKTRKSIIEGKISLI